MTVRRAVLACVCLLVTAPAAAAAPSLHAHRGGTVHAGRPVAAEETLRAYSLAARDGFVLEVDAKLTRDGVPGGDPRRHSRAHHRLPWARPRADAGRAQRLPARRARQPGKRPAHTARDPARLDPDDRTGAPVRARGGRRGQPRDQERAHRSGLRPHAGLRRTRDGRGAEQRDCARAAADPELSPGPPGRGAPAVAGSGHEPAQPRCDGGRLPRPGRAQPLRLDLSGVAGVAGLRAARAPCGRRGGALHAQSGRRRPDRRPGGRRRDHQRRPAGGSHHAGPAARSQAQGGLLRRRHGLPGHRRAGSSGGPGPSLGMPRHGDGSGVHPRLARDPPGAARPGLPLQGQSPAGRTRPGARAWPWRCASAATAGCCRAWS